MSEMTRCFHGSRRFVSDTSLNTIIKNNDKFIDKYMIIPVTNKRLNDYR